MAEGGRPVRARTQRWRLDFRAALRENPVRPKTKEKETTLKILDTKDFPLPGVHLLRFARFGDKRGYFTETFRRSDFEDLEFLAGVQFLQCNESHSRKGVIRGLHCQWGPFMGKLVRTIQGRMMDVVLDIRLGSPTYGKALAVEMAASPEEDSSTWIWVPPGFAHGNVFTESTTIEYFCSGEYNLGREAVISPVAPDIDWSLCDRRLKAQVDEVASTTRLMSEKDRGGFTLSGWSESEDSARFVYGKC